MQYNQFIEEMITQFKTELKYFTHPNVQKTAQEVGIPINDSWTKHFYELGLILKPFAVDRYIELERTVTSLYCLYLTFAQHYQFFIEDQKQRLPKDEMLSEENFQQLCHFVGEFVNDDLRTVIIYLIIYSDLGKSPTVRELANRFNINPRLDNDDIMLAILQLPEDELISILPSFAHLNESSKSLLRNSYTLMTTCLGHLFFLEGGFKTLETFANALLNIIPSQREQLCRLVFIAQFYDAAGSQGQLNMHGSVTCSNHFYRSYLLILNTLQDLEKNLRTINVTEAVSKALERYLHERATWIGWDESQFRQKEDYQFLLRFACNLRIFDVTIAKKIIDRFYKLTPIYQDLLREQLSFNKNTGINLFSRTPHYVATMAQNITRPLNDIDNVISKGLDAEICLALLIKEINEKHALSIDNRWPLSFGKIASRASESGFCNPVKFDKSLVNWTFNTPYPSGVIKNIIFDLGHVLLRIDQKLKNVFMAFSQLAAHYGELVSTTKVACLFNEEEARQKIADFHRGQINVDAFRTFFKEKLKIKHVTDHEFDQAWNASIVADPEEVKMRLSYLNELRNGGYNLYLLSNINEIHLNYLQMYGENEWGQYFFKKYYSCCTGEDKPRSSAFMQVIKENRLNPAQTLFLDDMLQNVKAAWSLGIYARQFTVDNPITDIKFIIDSFSKTTELSPRATRQASLCFFVLNKFKDNVEKKKSSAKLDSITPHSKP